MPLVHGTVSGYKNYKCKCSLCRGAAAEYRRKYLSVPENREKVRKRDHLRKKAMGPKRKREITLKQRYNLAPSDFDFLVSQQGGKCAICGDAPEKLCVDHNHSSGAVRELLCVKCNTGLGMFRDGPDITQKAADYLRVPDLPTIIFS